jgi:hypothetical protein
VEVVPRRALAPDARYTLLVGPGVAAEGVGLARTLILPLATGPPEEAAPVLELVHPPDGATGVVRNLRAIEARFSSDVVDTTAVAAVDEGGRSLPVRATPGECPGCVRLTLEAELPIGARIELHALAGAVDPLGRPVFGDPPGFLTGLDSGGTPALHPLAWHTADRCVSARFASDTPTEGELCVGARCAPFEMGLDHQVALSLAGLAAPLALSLRAWNETTAPAAGWGPTPVDEPSPILLAIDEILTRPLGPALGQQYVEVVNLGREPIDLARLTLHDLEGGQSLPATQLAVGGYALIVPSSYREDDGQDPPPALTATIVRVAERHLGGDGLDPDGEPVWIEDADGRVVTRWGGYPADLQPGQCVERVVPDDCDVPESFRASPSGTCSPGAP